jgi:large subunit ribosomal protein L1
MNGEVDETGEADPRTRRPTASYPAEEAFALLKELSTVKFVENVDVAVKLGVDPRKSDQVVRGSTVLPHGIGKQVRVAVFTQGPTPTPPPRPVPIASVWKTSPKKSRVATSATTSSLPVPDAMRVVGQLGKLLGPRGLMPNPKVGTVTPNVAEAVTMLRPVRLGTAPIGRESFTARWERSISIAKAAREP